MHLNSYNLADSANGETAREGIHSIYVNLNLREKLEMFRSSLLIQTGELPRFDIKMTRWFVLVARYSVHAYKLQSFPRTTGA